MDNSEPVTLQELLALTRDMGQLAAIGEWEVLVEKEAARRQMLEAFFAQPIAPQEADVVAQGIRAMMGLDEQIAELCQNAQKELVQLMGSVKTGQKMDAAYAEHR